MTPDERAAVEGELRALRDARAFDAAAALAVRAYGPEILGLLVAVLRDEDDARDAFADFSEDLLRGLPGFDFRCSFRTWAYTLARHAMLRFAEARAKRRKRNLPLSQVSEVARLAEKVATTTLPFLRTDVKDRVARLRETLAPADQTLLILRVDRDMAWNDIARIVGDGGDLERAAARLRKRYERLIEKLRELSRAEGLIE